VQPNPLPICTRPLVLSKRCFQATGSA
jgi:hypothetical protein